MHSWFVHIRKYFIVQSPEGILIESFALLIITGTCLLLLPWAHKSGAVGFVDALFTATSAVCVTGLVVVDTGTAYTVFGQGVILVLIQLGGLGVMTFAAIAFEILGRKLSLRSQLAVQEALMQQNVVATDFKTIFYRIVKLVLVIELTGAVILFIGFQKSMHGGEAMYSALFHSISAFCNAGFSLNADSLMSHHNNMFVMFGIISLIILGGIGHPVLVELGRFVWPRWKQKNDSIHLLSLHTRLVLWVSVTLIIGGTLLLIFLGLGPRHESWISYMINALFQSVSSRTAGFNSVDVGAMPLASLLILIVLMFIGGSPGSCAGGIKTTTFAVWMSKVWCQLRGEKSPIVFERHIAGEITRRVSLIIGLAVMWNLLGTIILLHTESHAGMHSVLFEQISAFGTVGLSTGLTPKLSSLGKVWIIATMFMGRLGPLTLGMAIFERRKPDIRYPSGKVMIG